MAEEGEDLGARCWGALTGFVVTVWSSFELEGSRADMMLVRVR